MSPGQRSGPEGNRAAETPLNVVSTVPPETDRVTRDLLALARAFRQHRDHLTLPEASALVTVVQQLDVLAERHDLGCLTTEAVAR